MIQTGIVRRWFAKHGYGFVTPDDGGPELFGRGRGKLRAGDAVEFTTQPGDRGLPIAVDVKRRTTN